MGHIVGIDIGGSTTKIVGFNSGKLISTIMVRADDPLTSAYGAFGKYLSENGLSLSDIDSIVCTGVGASYLSENIFGIPTVTADEFIAVGMPKIFSLR